MVTLAQARRFIAEHGVWLNAIGDTTGGWTAVAREYTTFKHSNVYFTITVVDPDGGLWQYLVGESTYDGVEVSGDPYPVTAVTQTKNVVTFTPRLVPRTQEST